MQNTKQTSASRTHRSTAAIAALTALAAAALASAAACGTTNVTNVNTTCGPGTRLVSGTCVVDAVTDGSAGTDVTVVEPVEDGGADADPNPDVGVDDPCPSEAVGTRVVNCDKSCGATIDAACQLNRCRTASEGVRIGDIVNVPLQISDNEGGIIIVRLPRNPWTVLGECDPSSAVPASAICVTPFQVASPQPKFMFGIAFRTQIGSDRGIGVTAKDYKLRALFEPRPTNTGGFESFPSEGCSRFEPLAKSGDFGEQDSQDCLATWALDFYRNVKLRAPNRTPLIPGQAAGGVIAIQTFGPRVPARNITIDLATRPSCPTP
jgi:hypothetical protein